MARWEEIATVEVVDMLYLLRPLCRL
jgi:hypothetical protein